MDNSVGDEMVNAYGDQALDVDDDQMFENIRDIHKQEIEEAEEDSEGS